MSLNAIRENKILAKISEFTVPFTNVGKACCNPDLYMANVYFNAIRNNKILAEILKFTVYCRISTFFSKL